MKTTRFTRPANYYDSPTIHLLGLDWIELPPNCRCGSFSKAATRAHSSPSEAVSDFLARPRPDGDCLLKTLHDGRWQIFERRQVIGRRWIPAAGDSCAVKGPLGPGRLFIR